MYTIKDIRNPKPPPPPPPPPGEEKAPEPVQLKPTLYFVHGRWFHRDQILVVTGTDAETERQISARPKRGAN